MSGERTQGRLLGRDGTVLYSGEFGYDKGRCPVKFQFGQLSEAHRKFYPHMTALRCPYPVCREHLLLPLWSQASRRQGECRFCGTRICTLCNNCWSWGHSCDLGEGPVSMVLHLPAPPPMPPTTDEVAARLQALVGSEGDDAAEGLQALMTEMKKRAALAAEYAAVGSGGWGQVLFGWECEFCSSRNAPGWSQCKQCGSAKRYQGTYRDGVETSRQCTSCRGRWSHGPSCDQGEGSELPLLLALATANKGAAVVGLQAPVNEAAARSALAAGEGGGVQPDANNSEPASIGAWKCGRCAFDNQNAWCISQDMCEMCSAPSDWRWLPV